MAFAIVAIGNVQEIAKIVPFILYPIVPVNETARRNSYKESFGVN